jgi:hypothetical protein
MAASPAPASFAPKRADADLVLVLVTPHTDSEISELIGTVTDDAGKLDATVLGFLGPLLLIAYGMPRPQANSAELRVALVRHLAAKHGASLRIVHGRWSSLVGNIGGAGRWSYGAVPSGFPEILDKLSKLPPGGVQEHAS